MRSFLVCASLNDTHKQKKESCRGSLISFYNSIWLADCNLISLMFAYSLFPLFST